MFFIRVLPNRSISLLALIAALSFFSSQLSAQGIPSAPEGAPNDPEATEEAEVTPTLPSIAQSPRDKRFTFEGRDLSFDTRALGTIPLTTRNEDDTFVLRSDFTLVEADESTSGIERTDNKQVLGLRRAATVFRLGVRNDETRVTRKVWEDGTLNGFKLKLSITGRCSATGANPDDFCTYTPGLGTVPGLYSPDTFVPLAFDSVSDYGQVISQETHDALFAPDFQQGTGQPGDVDVGINFDIPNAGFIVDEDNPNLELTRTEEHTYRVVPTIARVTQDLTVNAREAAVSRTTRALVLPDFDEEANDIYALMQLAALVLPEASSFVPPTVEGPNTALSNNIFTALENARVPANSFTIFQTGRAFSTTPLSPPQSAKDTPLARYNGIWMGMSPSRSISQSTRVQYFPTGDQVSTTSVASEGPFSTDLDVETLVTLLDTQAGETLAGIPSVLEDGYQQTYLDITEQNATRLLTFSELTKTKLVPHIAYSGNLTGGEWFWRYYTGVLFNEEENYYAGTDYRLSSEGGTNLYARFEAFSNPDLDNRSNFSAQASQRFALDPSHNLTLGATAFAELEKVTFDPVVDEPDAQASVFGAIQGRNYSLSITERFSRDDGKDIQRATVIGGSYRVSNRFVVNAEFTPFSEAEAYVEGALGISLRLGKSQRAPILSGQYTRTRYDLGRSSTGRSLDFVNDNLNVSLSFEF